MPHNYSSAYDQFASPYFAVLLVYCQETETDGVTL
jgi:hypothetical protein